MRTTLKTTTAVLACLNLAVPYPAIAQTGTAPGAAGPDPSSVCATNPASQECRDEIAQGLAEEETQAEEIGEEQVAGGDRPVETGDGSEPAAPQASVADPLAEDSQDPSAMEAGDAEEQIGTAQEPTGEAPEAGASEGGEGAPDEPVPDAATQAEGDASEPSSADALEAEAENVPDATAGEPLSDDLPEHSTAAEPDDGSTNAAPSPADAGESQVQAEQPGTGGESPEDVAEEEAASEREPALTPAPEEDLEEPDANTATSGAAPTSSTAPEVAPADERADRDAGPSVGTDAEAAAGGTTDIEADDAASDSAETGQVIAPEQAAEQDDDARPAQARNEAAADDRAEVEQSTGDGQSPAPIAAASANEAEAEEVITETVTEETARSSTEDFATQIDQTPEASSDEGDDGLSNLEKALLVGAGALAVGTLLRNGREVVASSEDRVVVSGSDGGYELIKDDNALLRRPGSEVQTETYEDGSTRTIVNRADGSQIITIRDPELRVVRRVRVTPEGQEILLIDDTEEVQPVDVSTLQARAAETRTYSQSMDQEALRQALAANQEFERTYSLNQVRSIEQVREQVPAIDLETITFASGSAAIRPEQAEQLTQLGQYIASRIEENPREIFLVEGHTDAVGDGAYNLALSDRRAESVALALTEYFNVPPENLVVQGYGEQFLKVQTEAAEQANRRASIRRITPLLQATVAR